MIPTLAAGIADMRRNPTFFDGLNLMYRR